MNHLILIDSDEKYQDMVKKFLKDTGIKIHTASTIDEGKKIFSHHYQGVKILLLETDLIDGCGLDLVASLQDNLKKDLTIIILTHQNHLEKKIIAFRLGVDDYLIKPITEIELKVRLEAKFQKSQIQQKISSILNFKDLKINIPLMKVTKLESHQEVQLDLTTKEFKLLLFLAKNEAIAFSRNEIVSAIWGDSTHVFCRTVDSHIYGLRQKMGHLKSYIECVPGIGYRFIASTAPVFSRLKNSDYALTS